MGQISLSDREKGLHLDLALERIHLYRTLEKEWNSSFELEETGGLFLFYNEEDFLEAETVVVRQNKAGITTSLLRKEALLSQEKILNHDILVGAMYCKEEGRINPLKTLLMFNEKAKALGSNIYENTQVIDFVLGEAGIERIVTNKGTIACKKVVIAAGAWTHDLCVKLGIDYPLHYSRGTLMVTEPTEQVIKGPLTPGAFLIGDIEEDNDVLFGCLQDKHGSILIGQDTQKVEDYCTDTRYDGLTEMASQFKEHFPTLIDLKVVRSWAGVTPFMGGDGHPLFGFFLKYQTFLLMQALKEPLQQPQL